MEKRGNNRVKRDLVDIAIDLLEFIDSCYDDPSRVRHALTYYRVYRRYMELFLQTGLVVVDGDRYIVTRKGREFIQLLKMLKRMIGEEVSTTLSEEVVTSLYPSSEKFEMYTPKKIYIGCFMGKARSIHDIIACILYQTLSPVSKTRAMVRCGLNVNQFSKYMDILLRNKLINVEESDGKLLLSITSRGLLYLFIYRRIINLLRK